MSPPAGAVARERPPDELVYTSTKLPNGLLGGAARRSLDADRARQRQYHVGSKNERPGRTGFAHLFEHLMFQGSKNVAQDQHQSLIASVGGESNATTNEDATVYWETVPSQYLPLALWLEADRMASLKVDEAAFTRERSVVKEERRQRIENPPYGRLAEIVYDARLHDAPLQAPGDRQHGRPRGRDASTTCAISTRPTTCRRTPCWSSPATSSRPRRWGSCSTTSAASRRRARPVPRDIPKEPPQTKERRVTVYEDVPLPAVVVAHHITFDGHPDSYPLHIVTKVLSDGNSSRIYKSLVYEKRLALAAFGGGNIIEHPNLFFATAIVKPGQSTGRRRARRSSPSSIGCATSRSATASSSARRTSSRATTSWAA